MGELPSFACHDDAHEVEVAARRLHDAGESPRIVFEEPDERLLSVRFRQGFHAPCELHAVGQQRVVRLVEVLVEIAADQPAARTNLCPPALVGDARVSLDDRFEASVELGDLGMDELVSDTTLVDGCLERLFVVLERGSHALDEAGAVLVGLDRVRGVESRS